VWSAIPVIISIYYMIRWWDDMIKSFTAGLILFSILGICDNIFQCLYEKKLDPTILKEIIHYIIFIVFASSFLVFLIKYL
jgi:hypothetical protein